MALLDYLWMAPSHGVDHQCFDWGASNGVDDRGWRADACRWPAGAEHGLGLVWMVSGMDSNLDGCDHVYEASRGGVWPQFDKAGE